MLAKKENKEIERAINTLDFISEDPKERERHNSIVMAEYNRLTSQHKRKFYRNSKRIIKNKNANRTNHTDNKTNKRRNRKNKIIENKE